MAEDLVRLGIIGAGSISRAHLGAIREGAGAKVVAVCDIIAERAQKRAAEYSIPAVFTDHRRMLDEVEMDAVVVAVPNNLHHTITIDALHAGKHVLCEKPMAITSAFAREMVEASHQARRVLAIGVANRQRSEIQLLRQMVERGQLGRIYYAKAVRLRRNGIPAWGTWFTRKEESGGGGLIDIGVHGLDLAWYLMGTPKPVSAAGATYAAFGPERRGLGKHGTPDWSGKFDVDDLAVGFIRMEDGSVINLEAGWAINMPGDDRVCILGERMGAISTFDNRLQLFSEVGKELVDTIHATDGGSRFRNQMQNFTAAIRGEAQVVAPGEQGLVVTRMLEAIYKSAKTGLTVALE